LTIATTTLDWRDAISRVGTLEFIGSILTPFADVFLTGDFNFDEGAEPETSHLSVEYVDIWPYIFPNRTLVPGYTWNSYANEYAYQSDTQSQPSRIDRVFVQSNNWMPVNATLVGCSMNDLFCQSSSSNLENFKKSPTSDIQKSYVSNHYGILVEFSHFEPHCV